MFKPSLAAAAVVVVLVSGAFLMSDGISPDRQSQPQPSRGRGSKLDTQRSAPNLSPSPRSTGISYADR